MHRRGMFFRHEFFSCLFAFMRLEEREVEARRKADEKAREKFARALFVCIFASTSVAEISEGPKLLFFVACTCGEKFSVDEIHGGARSLFSFVFV